MPNPTTRSASIPAVIESGRVLDVDISTYTLVVTTEFTKKPQTGVRFATPYQHFVNGEGIYFMPEVGSVCWVCFPSDGNRPFVLGWGPAGEEGDYRARKKDLNPGDIYLGTRDENHIILRRGGVVQIAGGPLCQRMFIPINNIIKDFCENYSLQTLGGQLDWTVAREEETTDGKRPALFSLLAREFANDVQPIAELLVGSHEGDDKTILSLLIKGSGSNGASAMVEMKFTKEGSAEWIFKKDVQWEIGGKLNIKATGDVSISGANMKLEAATGGMEIKGATTVKISGSATVDIDGAMVNIGKLVNVGNGVFPVLLADPTILTYLTMHVHKVIAPGLNSGPPMIGPPGAPPPGAPYAPAASISKKLISG